MNSKECIGINREYINGFLPSGETILIASINERVSVDVIEQLLQSGADPNQSNKRGQLPLHTAIRLNQEDVVEILLDHGAVVNALDCFGMDSLHLAMFHMECYVKRLISRGANVNALTFGTTPLVSAITSKKENLVEVLLECGADVNKMVRGVTPLVKATHNSRIFHLLLNNGADIYKSDIFLFESILKLDNHCDLIQFLIERMGSEMDPDSWKNAVQNIFPYIISSQCNQCLDFFMDQGLDPNRLDRHGRNILLYALNKKLIHDKCQCLSQGISSTREHQLLDCTKTCLLDPVNTSIIKKLIENGVSGSQAWDCILYGISSFTISKSSTSMITLMIRCQSFTEKNHLRTCSLFINMCKSVHPVLAVKLFIAGYNPTEDVINVCENILKRCRRIDLSNVLRTETNSENSWISYATSTPRTLQNLSVLAVRRHIGDNVIYKAAKLPVPISYQKIVTLEELNSMC